MNNLNKLAAVAKIKMICISQNMAIILGPVTVIAMVYGCKLLYGANTGGNISPALVSLLLCLGVSMNICIDGFMMVGTAIAEEKEKHTLRVLMTSSITGIQYFIGSILFPFLLTMAVNWVVLGISGVSIGKISLPAFFAVNAVVSFISCIIGMIVGICAKNQMSTSLISSPLMFVFMLIPTFGNMSESLHKISGFLFTGVIVEMTNSYANGLNYTLKPLDIAVLSGELIISILVFLILYKKNGYEKD